MEANEMEPGTQDEGREALEEFQRGHDEMGGAIAIRGFELKHDLTSPGAAEPFVATFKITPTCVLIFLSECSFTS